MLNLRNVSRLLKRASKMNYCLFFLVFPALLAVDAQARTLPDISLNNDMIITGINAGMTSSQLPPNEIRRSSSSSMFHLIFEIIGLVMMSNPPPKASSLAGQQVEITAFEGEIAVPSNRLTPSTSSILFSTPPQSGAESTVPNVRKRLSSPPAPQTSSSSSLLYATPAAAPPTIWPSSSKNDQRDQIINGISSTPSDDFVISMITDRKNDPLLS